jgi:nickel-dependent lactate racemase
LYCRAEPSVATGCGQSVIAEIDHELSESDKVAEPVIGGENPRTSGRLEIQTAAWYEDRKVDLELPESWDVSVFGPTTGPELTDAELRERLESPANQRPISERCSATTRPLIIVDDLNRPTPASRVLPLLMRQFTDAGIPRRNITILVGPGTHAPPSPDAVAKKVGAELIRECRVRGHDSRGPVVKVGRTSFGTPVLVPRDVVTSDFVVAVGGVYPNHTAGFGGGAKAALGILGFRSIAALHFRHKSLGWGLESNNNTFRRDLGEVARLIGLETGVLVVTNADRQIVDLACGDVHALYSPFLASAKSAFRAPRPDAGVRIVISNAYPGDLSLTFVQMKGMVPLSFAPPSASRIVIASCSEGLGFHGLFPFMNAPRFHRFEMLRHRVAANLNQPRRLATRGASKVARKIRSRPGRSQPAMSRPVWLYCPSGQALATLPSEVPGFRMTSSWSEIVAGVTREQNNESPLPTWVYTAAPLQWLD